MKDTFFEVPGSKQARMIDLYAHKKGFKEYGVDVPDSIASQKNKLILLDPKEDSFFFQGASIEDGGSGLVSTANDYLKFATMLLNKGSFNGKRILNPETVEIMTSNQVEKKAKPYKFDAFGFGVTVGVTGGFPDPVIEPILDSTKDRAAVLTFNFFTFGFIFRI